MTLSKQALNSQTTVIAGIKRGAIPSLLREAIKAPAIYRKGVVKMHDTQVAETILQQLGGRRFIVMTGSKNFVAVENGLIMTLVRNKSGANRLSIMLTPMDTYYMRFFKIRAGRLVEVADFDDVYCDQLQELFTSVTGLDTHL